MRVYTIIILSILASTVTVTAARVQLTIDPMMSKGRASAPVTIVEFSDYQ